GNVIRPVPQVREAPPLLEEEDNGVFLPEPGRRAAAAAADFQLAQLQPAAGGEPALDYPHLSEVPKRPKQMRAVKRGRGAAEEALQAEHEAAMEEKQRLMEEPTELAPAPAPVTLPKIEGMMRDIDEALRGNRPIVQAAR